MALAQARQVDQWRFAFSQRHDVRDFAHGQQLAPAPHIAWAFGKRRLGQRTRHPLQIVANKERLTDLRQAMNDVGLVPLAGLRTFEVCDESRAFSREVGVGAHV